MNAILLPDGTPVSEIADPVGLLRRAGILMTDEAERLDALEQARFCLVRIDGMGERWRCDRCNGKHAHFTKMCVPLPYRGLRDGLRAYWQNTVAPASALTPEQRERRADVGRLLGFPQPLPSLAEHHPETARALATADRSLDIGAWVLGTIDPITPAEARAFAARINLRAGRPLVRL